MHILLVIYIYLQVLSLIPEESVSGLEGAVDTDLHELARFLPSRVCPNIIVIQMLSALVTSSIKALKIYPFFLVCIYSESGGTNFETLHYKINNGNQHCSWMPKGKRN